MEVLNYIVQRKEEILGMLKIDGEICADPYDNVARLKELEKVEKNYKTKIQKRRKSMWNKPTEKQLSKMPAFYSTEDVPLKEKVIHMHFFIGGCDWYAAEYSPEEQLFFGFAILNNDYEMAEWGYFSLKELCELKVKFLEVDRDLHFTPAKAKDIENIRKAQGWN